MMFMYFGSQIKVFDIHTHGCVNAGIVDCNAKQNLLECLYYLLHLYNNTWIQNLKYSLKAKKLNVHIIERKPFMNVNYLDKEYIIDSKGILIESQHLDSCIKVDGNIYLEQIPSAYFQLSRTKMVPRITQITWILKDFIKIRIENYVFIVNNWAQIESIKKYLILEADKILMENKLGQVSQTQVIDMRI